MRYIAIPQDVILKTLDKTPTYTFKDFISNDINASSNWWSNLDWERAFDEITDKFEDAKVGGVVAISDTTFEKLEAVTRAVTVLPHLKPVLRFFIRAITQASTVDPNAGKDKKIDAATAAS